MSLCCHFKGLKKGYSVSVEKYIELGTWQVIINPPRKISLVLTLEYSSVGRALHC